MADELAGAQAVLQGTQPRQTSTTEIPRSPRFGYITADIVGVLGLPNGYLDLMILAIEGRMASYSVTSPILADGTAGQPNTELSGGATMTEIAGIRMSPEVAIDVAARLLEIGLQLKLLKFEDIEKRFADGPLKIHL